MMNLEELSIAARNLAHGLGISVYIRDGRIYQHGPGIEFLPPKGDRPTPDVGEDFLTLADEGLPE
jgi:hypothetical protein